MTKKGAYSSSSSSSDSETGIKSEDWKAKRKERREKRKESREANHAEWEAKREERKRERDQRKEQRKQEKEQKKNHQSHKLSHSDAPVQVPQFGVGAYTHHQMTPDAQSHIGGGSGDFYYASQHGQPQSGVGDQRSPMGVPTPPPYTPQASAPPPSGHRVPLHTQAVFPDASRIGLPVFTDADGSPIFIGSALFEHSVHPCKIGPHLNPFASVPYGGVEYGHQGRFDLLPFRHDLMEWVHTSNGRIPPGRTPIQGGYEEKGDRLYHAAAYVNGLKVPGKTGEHLGGARIPFGGAEHDVQSDYEILCWRF